MSRQAHAPLAPANHSPAPLQAEQRSPLRSEQVAAPIATAEIPAQIARAERFGHSLERINASSAAPPIQRVIYSDKGKKSHNAFKDITRTAWYKDKLDDTGRAWAHHLHGKSDEHFNLPELHAKIAELKDSGDATPELPVRSRAKKRRRETPLVERQTGAAVGEQVDYSTAKRFRTERRVIRRLEKAGKSPGDKNLYTKRYKPKGEKPFKLITSSIPPASLPTDFADRPLDELAENRLGQTLHSEGVTDKIEKNYPPFKRQKLAEHEHYSASSREQCESCRYHYPPQKPDQHKFGTLYSGTTDHIENEALRNKLVANQGIIGSLSLTDEERRQTAEARIDAAAARQNDPQQNPLLNKKRGRLGEEDSEGEQSSDDDDLYVTHDLDWGSTKGYGKGKVHVIPRRQYFSNEEFEEEKVKTQSLLTKRKERPGEEALADDEHGDPSSEDEEDIEED